MFDHLEPRERRALKCALELGFWLVTDLDDPLLWGDPDNEFDHVAIGLEINELIKDLTGKVVVK